MSSNKSATKGNKITMQSAATSGNGTALAIPSSISHHSFYVTGSSGIAGGAITFETANRPDYTGTWEALGAAVSVTADKQDIVQFEGTFAALRARISTAMVGGTVTVEYLGY